MSYAELLANAPAHETPEFLEYLRENNKVVFESGQWLVIENVKYCKVNKAWYTAFWKAPTGPNTNVMNMTALLIRFGHLEWKKKAAKDQTVRRFHIHMYEAE